MVGDTPDDMQAAAQAGVLPLAVAAPGDEAPAGGAWVLGQLTDLLELLP